MCVFVFHLALLRRVCLLKKLPWTGQSGKDIISFSSTNTLTLKLLFKLTVQAEDN